jgi:hypothetical protein
LVELAVCSINKLKPESLFGLNTLREVKGDKLKKSKFIEQPEEAGLIDKNLSIAAKQSKLKGLLNPISIAGRPPIDRNRIQKYTGYFRLATQIIITSLL